MMLVISASDWPIELLFDLTGQSWSILLSDTGRFSHAFTMPDFSLLMSNCLARLILFDHHERHQVDAFVGREPAAAAFAFPTAADARAILALSESITRLCRQLQKTHLIWRSPHTLTIIHKK